MHDIHTDVFNLYFKNVSYIIIKYSTKTTVRTKNLYLQLTNTLKVIYRINYNLIKYIILCSSESKSCKYLN